MNFLLFFSLNTFQSISTLTTVIFLSFSTIRSQISSLKLYAILVSLFFSKLAANDRGYGLGRSAGEFPVAMATKEMRAQRLPEAHQPPKAHRRVLAGRSYFVCLVFSPEFCRNSLKPKFSSPKSSRSLLL